MRVVAWFSCGAASAVAAKMAVDKYPDCILAYCDTSINEHPDNERFLKDVEEWTGTEVLRLSNPNYRDIYEVFDKTGWLVGPAGARCTTELKKIVRQRFQQLDDLQIFGLTYEESTKIGQSGLSRVGLFELHNPEIRTEWALVNNKITKADCYQIIKENMIELPAMYKMGYNNNNCLGCVKGQQGYWNKIRIDFPGVFERMAKQERKMNVAINKTYKGDKRTRLFLDELQPGAGRFETEAPIECGIVCGLQGELFRKPVVKQEGIF